MVGFSPTNSHLWWAVIYILCSAKQSNRNSIQYRITWLSRSVPHLVNLLCKWTAPRRVELRTPAWQAGVINRLTIEPKNRRGEKDYTILLINKCTTKQFKRKYNTFKYYFWDSNPDSVSEADLKSAAPANYAKVAYYRKFIVNDYKWFYSYGCRHPK